MYDGRARWVDARLAGPPLMPERASDRAAAEALLASSAHFAAAGLRVLAGTTGR